MSKVKAIPKDAQHTPHLVCAGAAHAIDFYKKAFGATEVAHLQVRTASSCTARYASRGRL